MKFDWRTDLKVSLQWCEDVKNTDVLKVFKDGYTGPVLAIAGKKDTTVDPEWSNKIVAASSNKASATHFIDGMDHTFNVFSETDLHSLMLAPACTNQLFPILSDEKIAVLERDFSFELNERIDEAHTAVRFVTSWATADEAVDALIAAL